MANDGDWDRRAVLRAAAVMAGAAATAPLRVGSAMAQVNPDSDADTLFKAGEFEQAGLAYEEILKNDSQNVHAARQRGYVGLLANNFPDAETYLTRAITLAPDDQEANRFLADCYTRQDKFALAAPRWQAAGEDAYAKLFAAIRGTPYEIHGEIGRAPWQQMDPSPLVEVSLNGGPPKRFGFYTRVASVVVSAEVAEEAGLHAVAETKLDYLDPPRMHFMGVLESFELGGIELRNIPVSWFDAEEPSPTGGSGLIGTWMMYHFLTTIDYAGRSLILRRRTPKTAMQARADAERAGAEPRPLWLAHEHIPFSRGSIAGSGLGVMGLHIGGLGTDVAGMAEETAKQLGIRIDYDRPVEAFAGGLPVVSYPCYPKEVRLGIAAAKDAYSIADQGSAKAPHGFDVLGHFSHSFFKPYNITLDFTGMAVYIARGKAT